MISVMISLLLAALDNTIVGTAMPKIIGELHGLARAFHELFFLGLNIVGISFLVSFRLRRYPCDLGAGNRSFAHLSHRKEALSGHGELVDHLLEPAIY